MPYLNFDQYEAEALAHLAHHFDRNEKYLNIDKFYRYDEFGRDRVMETIHRFHRLQLIGFRSRASIEIYPEVLSVVAQLRGDSEGALSPAASIVNNFHGHNARVNINSVDNSANSVDIDQPVFSEVAEVIRSQVAETVEREMLLELLGKLAAAAGKPSYSERYKEFISNAANHMSVLSPFIPALSQLLL